MTLKSCNACSSEIGVEKQSSEPYNVDIWLCSKCRYEVHKMIDRMMPQSIKEYIARCQSEK